MSTEEPMPEDIAGLFGKFGGNGNGYKEFAPPDAEAPRVWPLLSGEKIAHPPAVTAAAPVPAPALAPAPVPVGAATPLHAPSPAPLVAAPVAHAPAAVPVFAPEPAPAPAAIASGPGSATPLEQLFARLAAPQKAAVAQGPMSRWRRPT
ncbi:hypothetical protein [Variovorax sp. 350MFTsu5.1]|uniref:hypothetical protein n=1 Tax=Variovorax sp. 350MFTsu5.1 TaxID=3158365 RepID=UPI003AAB1CDA